MCHLSIEKALKSLNYKVLDEVPPKTHNLLYLVNKIGKKPEQELEKFIIKLNTASIAVGSRSFIEHVKALLGFRAKGREVRQGGGSGYQLREGTAQYKDLFRVEKDNLDCLRKVACYRHGGQVITGVGRYPI